MEPRELMILACSAIAGAVLIRYRQAIMEAIQRGPWNGGSPPPLGPAPAADPFRRRWMRRWELY